MHREGKKCWITRLGYGLVEFEDVLVACQVRGFDGGALVGGFDFV